MALCVYEPSGRLDPTFGDGGRLSIDASELTPGIEPSIDGQTGLVARAVAFAPGGGLLVAVTLGGPGIYKVRLGVARFDRSGRLDPTFGGRGVVTVPSGAWADVRALVLQPDGKIVIGGTHGRKHDDRWPNRTPFDPNFTDFCVLRFLPNGTPDPGFGTGGAFRSHLGTNDAVQGLAIAPDGAILAVGNTRSDQYVTPVLLRHSGR
jgi:uncharacterized delta-60 repeat protein